MNIPIWIILVVVFGAGWMVGIGGTFRDMRKNPKQYYERYIKYWIDNNNE